VYGERSEDGGVGAVIQEYSPMTDSTRSWVSVADLSDDVSLHNGVFVCLF